MQWCKQCDRPLSECPDECIPKKSKPISPHRREAYRLIREARRRSPTPILLNFVFNDCLEKHTDCKEARKAIRSEAKSILAGETS